MSNIDGFPVYENVLLKGEFAKFSIGLSDAPKYDIIWIENSEVIGSFQRYWRLKSVQIKFNMCQTRDGHALNTLLTSISLEGSDRS